MSNTNRTKGNMAELYYAKEFKELGYKNCKTSRFVSKIHDYAGIDLVCIPFNVQIKAGLQHVSPRKELAYIQQGITERLPKGSPENDYPKILINKKEVGKGNKRTEFDEIVFMTFSDFKKLINQCRKEQIE